MLDFILELVGDLIIGAAAGAAIALLSAVVYERITQKTIKTEVRKQCPQAIRAIILEKKHNAIDVGIFTDYSNEYSKKLTIESSEGVSPDLRVGMALLM